MNAPPTPSPLKRVRVHILHAPAGLSVGGAGINPEEFVLFLCIFEITVKCVFKMLGQKTGMEIKCHIWGAGKGVWGRQAKYSPIWPSPLEGGWGWVWVKNPSTEEGPK